MSEERWLGVEGGTVEEEAMWGKGSYASVLYKALCCLLEENQSMNGRVYLVFHYNTVGGWGT